LFDPGIFRIGDSLSEGRDIVFNELPTFSPEIFSKVSIKNALKQKQYLKGLDQLTEEGMVQVFRSVGAFEDTYLGVVGQLQFEVFEYRMKNEYGVDIQLFRSSFQFARWIAGGKADPSKFRINSMLVKDKTTSKSPCSRTSTRCGRRWRECRSCSSSKSRRNRRSRVADPSPRRRRVLRL